MRRFAAGLCVGFCLLVCASAGAKPSASSTISGWKRGAVCYEVFVRSFYDSDGDGIGDLNGLTQKLDYINSGDSTNQRDLGDRKSTRLNSSHMSISYAVFCLKKKKNNKYIRI